MPETPLPEAPDRPLVTFALFAYNQERFIREAVEGAFAQTYEPLEIILSDDCSTDRTFEIMQEMAAAYEGPHEVVFNRTESNLGVAAHVIDTCRKARGSIIVVAAGDDISYAHRVQRVVHHFGGDPRTFCMTSGFDLLDENGRIISEGLVAGLNYKTHINQKETFIDVPPGETYTVIKGATAAYRRELFMLGFPTSSLSCPEDKLFNFIIYANRKTVKCLPTALIGYRRHSNALSNFDTRILSAEASEVANHNQMMDTANLLQAMLSVTESCTAPERVSKTRIEEELYRTRIKLAWGDLSVHERLLLLVREAISFRSPLLRWQLVRLWGRFPNYVPKQFIHPLQNWMRSGEVG